jgi:type II secretory pathway pseudopilin PulG
MMERLRRRTPPDEQGFTLAELIVYSVLLIVVLGMAGSMFVRLIYAQRDIKALSEANNEAQLVFEQVELDLRNADWAEVSQNGTLLVVRTRQATAVTSTTAVCVGYYYDSSDGTLHRKQTSDSAPTTDALAAGSDGALKTAAGPWNTSMTNVATIGGTRVFGPADDLFEAPKTIEISLRANTSGNRKPIEFVKSVSLRPQSGLGSGCR